MGLSIEEQRNKIRKVNKKLASINSKRFSKKVFTKIYKEYLSSEKWASIKIDLLSIRGNKCERCGSNYRLEIHHLNYDNLFNEEYLDLEILCNKCHNYEHKNKNS